MYLHNVKTINYARKKGRVIKTLVVKEIKRSIELMDEFEDGDYEFLELQDWFWVRDLRDRMYSVFDNTGRFNISLMVSKKRNRNKNLCRTSPTMTELRQMQHHGVALDEDYEIGSMDQIIRDACKIWEKDVFVELETEICLRAQTSWNRMDYGCEWLGGGDWEEKTLYGDTTDFYITGIILRAPYKFITQEAREILTDLQNRYEENTGFIDRVMSAFKHVNQPVIHRKYGSGIITAVNGNKIHVQFAGYMAWFICPDSILQGYFSIPEHNDVIVAAMDRWNDNIMLSKQIRKLEYILEKDHFTEIYYAVMEYRLGKKA